MRIIKKLDIFVLKNYLTLFAGTFCISLFVVMMQFLWKYVDDLIGKGLALSVMAKFFFYAGETLVSLALPLAILLASLISFGNLGERLELLAIKAAGISLFRTLRPLIIFNVMVACGSFYFQDVVAPRAQQNLMQLLYSMRQKSPELDIPEGVFYDGIDGLNLYVKHKDKETGALYNIIIYNMRDGVDNAHIILADSGRLETSSDKQHLLLHLYKGEQFENLRSGALVTNNIPYRRETFMVKHFIIDFDTNFNMADEDTFAGSATTKNIRQLVADIDSLETYYDSLGVSYYEEMKRNALFIPTGNREERDSTTTAQPQSDKRAAKKANIVLDSVFAKMSIGEQEAIVRAAMQKVSIQQMDTEFKSASMEDGNSQIRRHWLKFWEKITMSLACIVFFFIGAPLGAIIRKGGLGLPVVVSVIIFIIYYIINTAGMKLGRQGSIPVWFGMWLSTIVLAPLGVFFTVKSNNDSVVFNMDAYISFFRKLWGIRAKRHIVRKEVIINTPDYAACADKLGRLVGLCQTYQRTHSLHPLPNYINLYFRTDRDEVVENIVRLMEETVEELSNSKDKQILVGLNYLPVIDTYAHTAPFRNRKLNIVSGVLFPIGVGLMFRIVRFRRRLKKDLRASIKAGIGLKERCEYLATSNVLPV